jgi:hypothetical protein
MKTNPTERLKSGAELRFHVAIPSARRDFRPTGRPFREQDLGDKARRASLFRLQEENQGVKLWG